MFYIFLLQANDLLYETTTQRSIDFDVNELLNDSYIDSSINPVKLLENTLKTIDADMLRLLFIVPQTDKVKAKVQVLMQRYQALKVSCRIII